MSTMPQYQDLRAAREQAAAEVKQPMEAHK